MPVNPGVYNGGAPIRGLVSLPATTEMLTVDAAGNMSRQAIPVASLGGSTGSNDNRILRADGTGGATVQSSAITIDDSGNISGIARATANAYDVNVGGALTWLSGFNENCVAAGVKRLANQAVTQGVCLNVVGEPDTLTIRRLDNAQLGDLSCQSIITWDLRNNSGIRVRNYANNAFAAFQSGAITSDSNIYAGAAAEIGFTGRTRITAPAADKIWLNGTSSSNGVQLSFGNGVLNLRDRTDSGPGTFTAGAISGTTGAFSDTGTSTLSVTSSSTNVATFGVVNSSSNVGWGFQVGGSSPSTGAPAGSFTFRQTTSDINTGIIASDGRWLIGQGIPLTSTQLAVISRAAGNTVEAIRGAVSQTGNLTEWQENSGTVRASVSASGAITSLNDANNYWRMTGQFLTGRDGGSDRIEITRAFGGRIYVSSSGSMNWTDGSNLSNSIDAILGRNGAGQLGVYGNNGLAVRNYANSADAAFAAGAANLSGALRLSTHDTGLYFGPSGNTHRISSFGTDLIYDVASVSGKQRFRAENSITDLLTLEKAQNTSHRPLVASSTVTAVGNIAHRNNVNDLVRLTNTSGEGMLRLGNNTNGLMVDIWTSVQSNRCHLFAYSDFEFRCDNGITINDRTNTTRADLFARNIGLTGTLTASQGNFSSTVTVGSYVLESEEQKTLKSLAFINAVWS